MATERTRLRRRPFPARDYGSFSLAATVMPTRRPWGAFPPMHLACMICLATCWNGRRIATTTTTAARRSTARLGHLAIVVATSFAAVPGTLVRGVSAWPSAAGTLPTIGVTTKAFVWPERLLLLESQILLTL